jgi:DNA-binding MarR family transcriptional regulator
MSPPDGPPFRPRMEQTRMDALAPTPDQIVRQLRSLTRDVQDYLAVEAKRRGLATNDFVALVRAVATDGVTGAQLARAFGMRSSSVTGLADRLEAEGLIARHDHPTDRRIVILRATRPGQALIRKSLGPVLGRILAIAEALDPPAREVVARFLSDVELALNPTRRTSTEQEGQRKP